MTSEIRFGTDGWRAIIGEDFTFDNVRVCAQSVAQYLHESRMAHCGLVVGYDTRFASEDFAAAVAEVVAANGIRVYLCDRATPTPTVSWSVLDKKAGGAVVITSSHNPWRYNGFKYKPEYAGSASPEVVEKLEAPLNEIQRKASWKRMPLAEAKEKGLVEMLDPEPAYFAQLRTLMDVESLRAADFTVCVDPMFGAGRGYLPRLLSGGRLRVIELHSERNPLFPGLGAPEPIGRNLGPLIEVVRREKADAGLATDGDADRFGLVDENGTYIDQLQVFGLLAYYLLEARGERGPIIKALTTTRMVMRLGELYGVPVQETKVGFKYLGPLMISTNALIGGEESGGYAFRGHIPERDGVLAALCMLDFIVRTGKRPSELLGELYERVGPHYYDRLDVELPVAEQGAVRRRVETARPESVASVRVIGQDETDGFRFSLENGGWLLLRFSGTEPLIRIYTEMPDKVLVPKVLKAGLDLAGLPGETPV